MISTIGVLMSLNDPQWGNRGNDNDGGRKPNQGPPDLEDLWRDLNQRLSGMFGKKVVQHVGCHQAGADRIHRDALRPHLHCHAPRQADDGMLGRVVAALIHRSPLRAPSMKQS